MITFSCDACAEAYDNGGTNCPHHDRLIEEDLRVNGQPPPLAEQVRRRG